MTSPDEDVPKPPPHAGDGHHFAGPGALDRALELVRYLRSACPWDAEQTAESLIPYLLEESHEVVDAIHSGDPLALEGELGDLLLNLAFQIVVAEESGALDASSVYGRLEEKMIGRHPELFGGGDRSSWAQMKADERTQRSAGPAGLLEGLATGLDPVSRAFRLQERAAGVGFDWDDHHGPAEKVSEELGEVMEAIEDANTATDEAVTEEIGDLLFAAVNLARLAGAHPTAALAKANAKFERRFTRLERVAKDRGIDIQAATLADLDEIWDAVKREEAAARQ